MPAYRTTVGPFAKLRGKPATDKAVKKKPLTRREKIAKLDADRKAAAVARASGGPATTQAQLDAHRKRTAAPTPKTPQQIRSEKAAALRGRLAPGFLGPLSEALKPNKKK